MNDYLWNRSGDADEETRRLEELLAAFRAPHPALRATLSPRRGERGL